MIINRDQIRIFRNLRNGIWEESFNSFQGEIADFLIERIKLELEDYKLEFKEGISSNQKIGRLISAISNEGGGSIFLGLSDDGTIVGFDKDFRKTSQVFFNIANSACIPSPRINSLLLTSSNNETKILAIVIPGTFEKLISYNDKYYKDMEKEQ